MKDLIKFTEAVFLILETAHPETPLESIQEIFQNLEPAKKALFEKEKIPDTEKYPK